MQFKNFFFSNLLLNLCINNFGKTPSAQCVQKRKESVALFFIFSVNDEINNIDIKRT